MRRRAWLLAGGALAAGGVLAATPARAQDACEGVQPLDRMPELLRRMLLEDRTAFRALERQRAWVLAQEAASVPPATGFGAAAGEVLEGETRFVRAQAGWRTAGQRASQLADIVQQLAAQERSAGAQPARLEAATQLEAVLRQVATQAQRWTSSMEPASESIFGLAQVLNRAPALLDVLVEGDRARRIRAAAPAAQRERLVLVREEFDTVRQAAGQGLSDLQFSVGYRMAMGRLAQAASSLADDWRKRCAPGRRG